MAEVVIIETTKPDDREYNADLVRTVRDFGLHPAQISYADAPYMTADLAIAKAVVVSGVPLHYPSETAEELQPVLGPILHDLAAEAKPTLTICLGHQVLGLAFGATLQREVEIEEGIVTVAPTAEAIGNPLFQGLDSSFTALSSHWASIDTTKAADLVRIASSLPNEATESGCKDEVVQVKGAPMWGVQFHPEKIQGEAANDGRKILRNFFKVAQLID